MIPNGVANYRETNSVRRSRFRYFVLLSSFPFLDSSRSSRINVCWLGGFIFSRGTYFREEFDLVKINSRRVILKTCFRDRGKTRQGGVQ